jgi:hypothetical protein
VLVTQSLKLFHGLPLERLRMVVVMARDVDGTGKSYGGEDGSSWWSSSRAQALAMTTLTLKPFMTREAL